MKTRRAHPRSAKKSTTEKTDTCKTRATKSPKTHRQSTTQTSSRTKVKQRSGKVLQKAKRDECDDTLMLALNALGEAGLARKRNTTSLIKQTANIMGSKEHQVASLVRLYVDTTEGKGHPEGMASWIVSFFTGLDLNALMVIQILPPRVPGVA